MLIIFYLLTPIMLMSNSPIQKHRCVTSIFVFFLSIVATSVNNKIHFTDNRVILYFPYYVIGIYAGPNMIKELLENYGFKLFGGSFFLLFTGILFSNYYWNYFYLFAGVIMLLLICFYIEKWVKHTSFESIVVVISYSSMSAYFFHRQIYFLLDQFDILTFFWPFIVIMISYIVQLFYDKILNYCCPIRK